MIHALDKKQRISTTAFEFLAASRRTMRFLAQSSWDGSRSTPYSAEKTKPHCKNATVRIFSDNQSNVTD